MSTYIKLNKQDAYVTSYTAHKSWYALRANFSDYAIDTLYAISSSGKLYTSDLTLCPGYESGSVQYAELVYKNIHHLYYAGYNQGEVVSSSYENYKQTTLYDSASRSIGDIAYVIALPKEVYGHAIVPGSFMLTGSLQADEYITQSFVSGGFIIDRDTDGFAIYDDGEGVLRDSNQNNLKVGDIIYTHGHAIITDTTTARELLVQDNYGVSWRSSYTLYTHNYHCRVNESQLNYSQNPTLKSGSLGYVYDYVTGSSFQPYVTTVGLYNDMNELIAIGKMAQPIPKSKYMDTTFLIKFDI